VPIPIIGGFSPEKKIKEVFWRLDSIDLWIFESPKSATAIDLLLSFVAIS